MKIQTLIIYLTAILIGCNIKNNSKIVEIQNDNKEILKEVVNEYYGDKELDKNEGIYNIDSTNSNLHTYKDFKFLLKKDSLTTKLLFVSCELWLLSYVV